MAVFSTSEAQTLFLSFFALFQGEGIHVHRIGVSSWLEVPSTFPGFFFLRVAVAAVGVAGFSPVGTSPNDSLYLSIRIVFFGCFRVPLFKGGWRVLESQEFSLHGDVQCFAEIVDHCG